MRRDESVQVRSRNAVTDQDLETLLQRGYQSHGIEFKGPGKRTDSAFLSKVIRAVIGMANRREGGVVVIGVDSDTLVPIGLEDDQADTWSYDHLATSVNGYASPSVSFDLETKRYQGRKLIIIQVHEFADIPILCRKDYQSNTGTKPTLILRRGACYVRSRHKPETSEIPSEEEMRELLELAVDKGVEKFVARARKAGLFPGGQAVPASPDDKERFKEQIEDLE